MTTVPTPIGNMKFQYKNHFHTYKVKQFKNGKYHFNKWYGDEDCEDQWKYGSTLQEFLEEYSKATLRKEAQYDEIPDIEENTIPKDHLKRMKLLLAAGAL